MNENKLHKNLQEQPKSPEVKRISKLHLLVHPGFITEEDIKEAEVDEEDLRLGAELFESYIKKAKGLKDDEIMVIISPSTVSGMKFDSRKPVKGYLDTIHKIKEILGDRCVVFGDDLDFLNSKETQDKIRKLLKARGYYFDDKVLSEAYGETLGSCVDEAADGFNLNAGLKDKTIIRTSLTNSRGEAINVSAERGKRWGWDRVKYEE